MGWRGLELAGGGLAGTSEETVDDGDGEGVGSIVGLGDGGEIKMEFDHSLDLRLVGLAVAADGLFDLVRGVFVDGEVVLFGNQETDAAGLGDRDAGGDVLLEEEFFNCHDVGVVCVNDFVERVINIFQAVGEWCVGRGGDDAVVKGLTTADDTEAADAGAGVNAEDAGRGRGGFSGAGSDTVGAGSGG